MGIVEDKSEQIPQATTLNDPVAQATDEQAAVAGQNPLPGLNVAGAEAPAPHRKPKERAWFAGSVQSLASTVVIALFVITFVVQAFQIPSESMENTLLIGDYLLVDKVHFGEPGLFGRLLPYARIKRGDIIVFRYPVHPAQHFVKRVIGVPGDHVRLIDKRLYVNGAPVAENYVIFRQPSHDTYRDDFPRTDYLTANVETFWWLQMRSLVHGGELVVPRDQYFVMGDNRDESLDSRYWGFVPRENIIGRPLVIYWSLASTDPALASSGSLGDKVEEFAYAVTHVFRDTRWNRTFRLVR